MAAARYYHPDYRKEDVSRIVGALDQGYSVSVIGPPSVGKSNLLKFLDHDPLTDHNADNPWVRYAPNAMHRGALVPISVDPNALLPALPLEKGNIAAQAWPGFELLVHRTTIMQPLYPGYQPHVTQPADTDLATRLARLQEQFENAHPDVTDFDDQLHAHLALRHLESILDAALTSCRIQDAPIRVVYIMDEFERLLNTMPDYFFVALRSIRDRFKYQVMFVTFTRNSLPYLIGDGERMVALEPFVELFNDTTIYLKPFGDDDAWRMVEQLEERAVSKDDHGLGLLIRATGGFAGLLRAGFQHAEQLAQIQASDYHQAIGLAASRLSAEPNVQAECRTLLRGLRDEEIQTLYGVALEKTDLNAAILNELILKSLLAQASSGTVVRVSPPVLAAYIRNHPTPPPARLPARPVTMPR